MEDTQQPEPGKEIVAAAKDKEPAIEKLGKKNISAVFIAATDEEKKRGEKGQVIEFSDQEAAVLRAFLKTHNYEATAVEVAIKVDSVKRILRRPNLKKYLQEIIAKAAIAEGTDVSWAVKELRLVWEGQKEPTATQMEAMKQLGKILTPKGPGVVINNQQSAIYGGMSREVIDAEWADARTTAAD